MKVTFKDTSTALRKRIARLPQLTREMADTTTKKDAIGIIQIFQDGIRNNTFNLIKLSPDTISRKKREGLPRPSSPLYGAGDTKKNSLINVLKLRKLKNGWSVYQSAARHWKSRLPLNFMLLIHEAGATIDMGTHIVRIPPRPVRQKAFDRYLRKRSREENVQVAREAINLYLRTGDLSKAKKYINSVKSVREEK